MPANAQTTCTLVRRVRAMLAGLALLVASGVAQAAIAFVAASTNTANASSISLSSPAGTSTGDLMLAVVASRGGTSVSAPLGWTAALTPQTVDAGVLTVATFYRVRAASDGATFSFSLSSSDRVAGTMLSFSGVDSAAPVLNALGTVAGASTSSPSATGFSTTVANAMLVAAFAQSNGNNDMTPPTGMAEASDIGTGAGPNGATLESAYVLQAGTVPTGSKVASSIGSARSVAALIALRPASTPTYSISGTVFEDINYGGGAGRSLAGSSGAGVANATVELYSSAGVWVSSTTTAAGGTYSFSSLTAATHHVRVASSTVASTRTGSSASLVGVLTYRTNASTGAAVAVTDFVGGTNPALADPGAGSTGAAFNISTGVFSAVLSGTAQAFAPVTLSSANITSVDFGFNFGTVVNVNNSGQGSLRQAVTNANALGTDTSLAVAGRTAGVEHINFMLSNGSSAAGLRSANNYFSGGVASIALTAALPDVTATLVLDARTQPGWASAPLVELNGSGAGALSKGLRFTAGANVVAGLVVNRFLGSGIELAGGSGSSIVANYVGSNAAGTAAAANGVDGIVCTGTAASAVIGGSTSGAGNLISGNTRFGISLYGCHGSTIRGNTVGRNVANSANLANGSDGIAIVTSNNTVVGGLTAGAANVIAGNGRAGVYVNGNASGNSIRGNSHFNNTGAGIDLTSGAEYSAANGATNNDGAKTGSAPNLLMDKPVTVQALLGSSTLTVTGYVGSAANQATFAGALVDIYVSSTHSSGFGEGRSYVGTLTADANGWYTGTLSTSGVSGLTVGSTQLTATATDASGNTSEFGVNLTTAALSAFANGGFELGANNPGATFFTYAGGATGITNWVTRRVGVDHIGGYWQTAEGTRSIDLSGNNLGGLQQTFLTVAGQAYTLTYALAGNTGCGTAVKTMAVRVAAASATVTFNSSGKSTAAMGWVNQTLAFTATSEATTLIFDSQDANACGPALDNVRLTAGTTVAITGSVFEDVNYGGGAGRSKATAMAGGGSLRPNARVELYSVSGSSATFSAATTTDASGNYSFTVRSASTWAVRVVSSSVLASRTGATAALLPVLTARSEWDTNAAWQVSDHVGGINPALGDAAAASTGAAFNTSTGVFSAGVSGTAQAFSLVVPGATAPSGVDFGFNFATVVNVGDSGAGSLRQVVSNANALGADAGLAASGRTGGIEHVIFMIGNGTSGAGLRASVNLFSSGVAVITPTSALPAVSAALVLDARTQPGWVSAPVLDLRGSSAGAGVAAFALSSSGSTVAGWAIKSFGGAGVVVTGAVSGNAVLGNHISGNTGLGIDLANNGLSANDGAKSSGQPNVLMDAPVITSASISGSALTLSGHIGSAAGQSLFAGSRVEFFLSDNHVSGYGAGSSYLGTLTSDASGNFSGTITVAGNGLASGSKLSATATDISNNTSEFSANFAGVVVNFVVNDNGDAADAIPGDGYCATTKGGVCTLRAAMEELNAQGARGAATTIIFNLPKCQTPGDGGCVITPEAALPIIKTTMVIDGSSQPGWNSKTCAPWVELNGEATAAGVSGLVVAAERTRIQSLVIRRFGGSGITLAAGTAGHTVLGNRIGTNAAGGSAEGNAQYGIEWLSSESTIGGGEACQGNLISGNQVAGVFVSAKGGSMFGNVVGPTADGKDVLPSKFGVWSIDSSGLSIGGETPELANTVAGHAGYGLWFDGTSSGITVTGNTITRNSDSGIVVTGSAAQVAITANAISDNGGLGIDLGADGVSPNTGKPDDSRPNAAMNYPAITGAGIAESGTSMTLYGYIGVDSGQAAFAGARVEIFKAADDPSGNGEGQVYLGSLTADSRGQFSGSIAFPDGTVRVGDTLTATATDVRNHTSEFGPTWVSTTTAALTPAGFNAFDSGTAAGSTAGSLSTRVAGSASSVDVVALNSAGTGLHPGFTGTVTLTWLDARDDRGAVSGSCRESWVSLGSAGSAAFASTSRASTTLTPPATATRVMRLMISYASGSDSVRTCSGDAFAVIPASLSLAASDQTSATAGLTRSLANTSVSGGVVHQAGRPFSVTATARDALGNVMSGYEGTPTLAVTGCVLPAGCTASSLALTPTSAVAGQYANHSVSYAEVGAITLQLSDPNYADVDALDTSASARRIASPTATAGRFVPDSLSVSVNPAPLLGTANAACMASGSGATFFGQGFGWASAPQVTVTARNAAGTTTQYWSGGLMKLVAAHATPTMAASGAGSATLASSFGALSVTALGAGQARINASSLDRFVLDMAAGTVQASLSPSLAWTLSVNDSSEVAVAGNPSLSASTTQSALGFDAGAVFHSGRLALSPGHGDARVGVRLLLELQRYASAGWVTMTEDRGCVTVAPANLGVELPSGVFATLSACAAPLSVAVSTRGGRAWLPLPATPSAAPGRLGLRLAGAAATGNSCGGLNSLQALTPLNLPWLISGSGPLALASWGRANRETVLRREVW